MRGYTSQERPNDSLMMTTFGDRFAIAQVEIPAQQHQCSYGVDIAEAEGITGYADSITPRMPTQSASSHSKFDAIRR